MNAYSVGFEVDYGDGRRRKGLAVAGIVWFAKAILLIPHLFVLFFVYIGAGVAAYVGFIVVAFTGRLPEGIFNLVSGALGWSNRASAWLFSLTDEYPPFGFEAPGYPARYAAEYGDGTRSRGLAVLGALFFLKAVAALPHLIIIGVLGYAAGVASWVGFWIIAFTGKLPEGLHRFVTGTLRWQVRTGAWIGGLVDEYPPFSLD